MKLRNLLPMFALAAAFVTPAKAAILVDGIGDTMAVPDNFAFKSQLEADSSLVTQSSNLLSISLTEAARITFYALGSESNLENSFFFGSLNDTEQNYSYDPTRVIGSVDITSPGTLGGLLFTSSGGLPAVPGLSNFGIFLPSGFSGTSFLTDRLVFGYDDGGPADDDFDDFVIAAQISPIPEVRTWFLMLAGFGLVGMQLRRNRLKAPSVAY